MRASLLTTGILSTVAAASPSLFPFDTRLVPRQENLNAYDMIAGGFVQSRDNTRKSNVAYAEIPRILVEVMLPFAQTTRAPLIDS